MKRVTALLICTLFSSTLLARGSAYTAETYDVNVSLEKTNQYRVLAGEMWGVVLETKGCPEFSINDRATLYVYSVNDIVLKFFSSGQECQVMELRRNVHKEEMTIKTEE